MPRTASKTPSGADSDNAATAKPLPSLVDEVQVALAAIAARLPPALLSSPSVEAWAAPGSSSCSIDWPALPAAVDPAAANMGRSTRLSAKKRAKKVVDAAKVDARVGRKRQQVESFYLVLRQVVADIAAPRHAATAPPPHGAAGTQQADPQQQQPRQQQLKQHEQQQPALAPLHLVDFGCGTGNLLLPLAALFPHCRFTGVDMKPAALLLLQQRAAEAGLTNVQVFEGMIETFRQPFDVALALHACGNATDHVLQLAAAQAAAFLVSPCCVGKLKFSMAGGSSFHSSAFAWTPSMPGDGPTRISDQQHLQQQASHVQSSTAQECSVQQQQQPEQQGPSLPPLQHPRSSWLKGLLPQPEHHFRIMARVADIAHAPAEQPLLAAALAERAAVADCCKRFVELDRCAAAAEAGYAAGLFKVLGAETMAKNDLLVGVMQQQQQQLVPGTQTQAGAEAVADAAGPGSPSRGGSSLGTRLCTIDRMLLSQVQA